MIGNRPEIRQGVRAAATLCFSVLVTASAYCAPASIPDFAPDDHTSWGTDRPDGDNFLPPESGAGPVQSPKEYPYIPNVGGDPNKDFAASHPTYRISDLSNPILQPWVAAELKRGNDKVLAGQVPFNPHERCYPAGVPDFLTYTGAGTGPPMIFFIQTPKEVLMIWRQDDQMRHIYLNVPHSKTVPLTWYGELVGHYEGGDTLVVDTVGLSPKSFADNYNTPHTDKLHVVERYRMVDGGKRMIVTAEVEDPGAFTRPWTAVQRLARFSGTANNPGTLVEDRCAEAAAFDAYNYGTSHVAELVPLPTATHPDF